jgi:hypothetical protein
VDRIPTLDNRALFSLPLHHIGCDTIVIVSSTLTLLVMEDAFTKENDRELQACMRHLLFAFLFVTLSLCLSVSLSLFLSFYLSLFLSVSLSPPI